MTPTGDLARLQAALELETGEGIYLVRLGYPRDGDQVGKLLERLGRTVVRVEIATGGATRRALAEMEVPREQGTILWLDLREALATDHEAFAWMFARINEHRNELLRTTSCPWIICAPEWLVKGVRDWAPDLWSVRRGEFEVTGTEAIDAPSLLYWSALHPTREVAELRELRARLQNNPADPMALWALQDALGERAKRQLEAGRADTALSHAREALELARRMVGYDPQLPAFKRSLANALDLVGEVQAALGKREEARSAYAESLDLRRALVDSDPTQPGWLHDVGLSLDHLGDIDLARGSLESARAHYAEALAISRQLLASAPAHADRRRDLAVSLSKLGDVDLKRGALASAQESYEESLRVLRELAAGEAASPEARRDVSIVLNRLGAVLVARGEIDAARTAYAESLDIIDALLARGAKQPGLTRDQCAALRAIASVDLTLGDLLRARAACERAVELARWLRLSDATRPEWSRDLSECLRTLGSIERARGNVPAARAAYEEAGVLCEEALGRDQNDAQAHVDLAAALLELSELDPAAPVELLERAIASARAAHALAPALVRSRSLLASLLRRRGDPASLREADLLGLGPQAAGGPGPPAKACTREAGWREEQPAAQREGRGQIRPSARQTAPGRGEVLGGRPAALVRSTPEAIMRDSSSPLASVRPLSRFLVRALALSSAALVAATAATGCAAEPAETADHDADLERVGERQDDLFVKTSVLWPTLYWSSGQQTVISVCWENDPQWAAHAHDRDTVRAAIEDTWERETAIQFTGWGACGPSGANVRMGVFGGNPNTAVLGSALNNRGNGVMFNFDYTTWSPGCQTQKDFCTAAIAAHEFGHVLGFAHEQNRNDTPSSCNQRQGEDGDTNVGPWDSSSIMNYCNVWNNNGVLSPGDIAGAQQYYGRKPRGAIVGWGSRCLDAFSAGTANATPLQTWDCLGGSNQQWSWNAASKRIVGTGSGRDVEVRDILHDNGARVQLWSDWGGPNQLWSFDATRIRGYGGNVMTVPSGAGLVSGARVTMNAAGMAGVVDTWSMRPDGTIRPTANTSLCLDLPYGDTRDGIYLQVYTCHGGANQQWSLRQGGELRGVGDKCVDVRGVSTAAGAVAQIWSCHGGLNQKWNLRGPITVYGNKCMEVGNYNRENGAAAQIWDCYGGANQQWDYYPLAAPKVATGAHRWRTAHHPEPVDRCAEAGWSPPMRFAISITHNFLLEPFMKTMGVSREDSFIEVDKETLHVRMGRWFDEKIPVARIKAIAPSDWPWWGGLGVKLGHHGVGVVGSMDHIVNIKFSEEIRVRVLFEVGVEQMWVSLEDRDGFLRALADATGVTVSPHTPF